MDEKIKIIKDAIRWITMEANRSKQTKEICKKDNKVTLRKGIMEKLLKNLLKNVFISPNLTQIKPLVQ